MLVRKVNFGIVKSAAAPAGSSLLTSVFRPVSLTQSPPAPQPTATATSTDQPQTHAQPTDAAPTETHGFQPAGGGGSGGPTPADQPGAPPDLTLPLVLGGGFLLLKMGALKAVGLGFGGYSRRRRRRR